MGIDTSTAAQVELGGKLTPVFLRDVGPKLTESRLNAFEQTLHTSLPSAYREFLLRYNGGYPLVGEVRGRDDKPDVPYQHGEAIRHFLSLDATEGYNQLVRSADHPWKLPDDFLVIGYDSFGNASAIDLSKQPSPVLFLDHESFEDDYDPRVMANDFADLLLRVKTVAEADREEAERIREERLKVVYGKFPAWFTAGANTLSHRLPDLAERFRTLCLSIFDTKSHFSIHDDEQSRLFMDVCAWVRQSQNVVPPIYIKTVDDVIGRWMKSGDGELSISGFGYGFAGDWLADREARGWITRDKYFVFLTDEGIANTTNQLLQFAPTADAVPSTNVLKSLLRLFGGK